ncbi:MAG: 6-phosphogluconolactonase [Syntrophorhabdus sp. PtaU1.Bin153]|nr:MAG: 6-phosphogluconolactonase [Syntrophorhabdus sp. PtaU1.Bin153]
MIRPFDWFLGKRSARLRSMDENREILVFDSDDALDEYAVSQWQSICRRSIKEKGYAAVALSGGKTPISLHRRLAGESGVLSWDTIHVFFVDERFVPPTDDESNGRMIEETLLAGIDIPRSNVHAIPTEGRDPDSAAWEYEGDMRRFFNLLPGRFPEFDLITLGIGEDGHTASLFPGGAALQEQNRLAVPATGPTPPVQRITLTLPVLNHGRNILLVARGLQKADVLKRVVEEQDRSLPAALVRPSSGKVLFLIDQDAGVFLRKVV